MIVPVRAVPVIRLIKRAIFGRGSLEAVAYRREILCPPETATLRPAIFLPGQLEKIMEINSSDPLGPLSRSQEIEAATSLKLTRAATIAYHVKNAILFDGAVYVGHFKHRVVSDGSIFTRADKVCGRLDSCALASTLFGTKYFGHWLADDCTRYLLAEEYGRPLCVRMAYYGHKQKYQEYFWQDWTPIDRAHIKDLVIFQDFSQNTLKRNRYTNLQNRLKTRFSSAASKLYVYLRRGKTQNAVHRNILNEEEIEIALTQKGFVVIDASDDVDNLIKSLINAKIVISIEGSHIAHYLYTCSENSGLLVLQPPDRFAAVHRDWADCLGVRFGFVVGEGRVGKYHFSIPDILRTLDLMLNETGG